MTMSCSRLIEKDKTTAFVRTRTSRVEAWIKYRNFLAKLTRVTGTCDTQEEEFDIEKGATTCLL
jgi:hypothetical protein